MNRLLLVHKQASIVKTRRIKRVCVGSDWSSAERSRLFSECRSRCCQVRQLLCAWIVLDDKHAMHVVCVTQCGGFGLRHCREFAGDKRCALPRTFESFYFLWQIGVVVAKKMQRYVRTQPQRRTVTVGRASARPRLQICFILLHFVVLKYSENICAQCLGQPLQSYTTVLYTPGGFKVFALLNHGFNFVNPRIQLHVSVHEQLGTAAELGSISRACVSRRLLLTPASGILRCGSYSRSKHPICSFVQIVS